MLLLIAFCPVGSIVLYYDVAFLHKVMWLPVTHVAYRDFDESPTTGMQASGVIPIGCGKWTRADPRIGRVLSHVPDMSLPKGWRVSKADQCLRHELL